MAGPDPQCDVVPRWEIQKPHAKSYSRISYGFEVWILMREEQRETLPLSDCVQITPARSPKTWGRSKSNS